jgi:Glucose / Sorbosone dehydrogenase
MRVFSIAFAAVAAIALLAAAAAPATSLEQVGPAFDQPMYVTSDPGDADRLFVAEREGTIQLLAGGVASEFADLRPEVRCEGDCEGERGLLSIAPAPDFDQSGRLYAAYADDVDGTIHVDELLAAGPAHETATVVRSLLQVPHPGAANHNGGQLQFGPDGALYVSTGDGGGRNDEFENAQDPSSRLGKILRIEGSGSATPSISIWSLGLRNPHRFSFDALSGDMVIGDVGQDAREEIDFAPSPFPGVVGGQGANYGWNCEEGLLPGPATDPQCAGAPADAFIPPVFDYGHTPDPGLNVPNRCAVTGGYVVRDPGLGALYGRYVYADYCSGVVRTLRLPATATAPASEDCALGPRVAGPVSFGEDAAARLYVVARDGAVFRLVGQPPLGCPPAPPLPAPAPTAKPQLRTTIVGIKPQRRRVERGKRALLTVWVSPCDGRYGHTVRLLRAGRPNGSRAFSRACTARFAPKIGRGTGFRAFVPAQHGFAPGESRPLRIRIAPHRRHR